MSRKRNSPRKKTIDVFKVQELEGQARERAMNWLMEGTLGFDWWESELDFFNTELPAIGVDLYEKKKGHPEVYFSVSYSQGDGLCWTGNIDLSRLMKSKKNDTPVIEKLRVAYKDAVIKLLRKYRSIVKYINFNSVSVYVKGQDRYYTSTVQPIDIWSDAVVAEADDAPNSTELRNAADDLSNELESLMQELADDVAGEMFKALRDESDYLSSEKALFEYADANDYVFDEHGRIA